MRIYIPLLILLLIFSATDQVSADPSAGSSILTSDQQSANGNGSFDSDARSPLTQQISEDLSMGAKFNFELQVEDNFDVDRDKTDTLFLLNPKASVAALYLPTDRVEIFGEVRIDHENPLQDTADDEDVDTVIEFREGYILLHDFIIDHLALQVGRQRFKDSREWFIDDRLDAVRFAFEDGPWLLELSASSMLLDPDDEEDEIANYILKTKYQYTKDARVTFYGITRQDHSEDDRDPIFLGLSWKNRLTKRDKVWLDGAYLFGEDGDKDLSAGGFDVGWSHRFKHDLRPNVTFAFAYGSGDSDPDSGTDHAFQQTDLQDNNGKFWGISKFKYYGEVFDPELSNMMIFTAGFGVIPSKKKVSLDVVYHYYRLLELTDELRDAGVEEDLTGKSRDLGHEIDLILGLRPKDGLSASVSGGVFIPGDAYMDDRLSFGAEVKFQISF